MWQVAGAAAGTGGSAAAVLVGVRCGCGTAALDGGPKTCGVARGPGITTHVKSGFPYLEVFPGACIAWRTPALASRVYFGTIHLHELFNPSYGLDILNVIYRKTISPQCRRRPTADKVARLCV